MCEHVICGTEQYGTVQYGGELLNVRNNKRCEHAGLPGMVIPACKKFLYGEAKAKFKFGEHSCKTTVAAYEKIDNGYSKSWENKPMGVLPILYSTTVIIISKLFIYHIRVSSYRYVTSQNHFAVKNKGARKILRSNTVLAE